MARNIQVERYLPSKLALNVPAGDNVFEFAIQLRADVRIIGEVLRVFERHHVEVKSGAGEQSDFPIKGAYVLRVFCDFTYSDTTVEGVEWDLRHISNVYSAQSISMKGRLWDAFSFPIKLYNGKRVIVLRVEPMLRIERHLIQKMGSAGASVMFEQGQVYAESVLQQYSEILPNATKDQMLQALGDEIRATGFGILSLTKLKDAFEVQLADPPILEEADYTENRFLYGVVMRMLELVFDCKLRLSTSSFDKSSRVLTFRLVLAGANASTQGEVEKDRIHIAYASEKTPLSR